jgi:hypothetical protein
VKLRFVLSCVVGVALAIVACSGDDAEPSSTTVASTTSAAPVTSVQPVESTSTTTVAPSSTTTTSVDPSGGASFPEYAILSRELGDEGDTIVVLLDEDSYDSLTDIDLQNVLVDVVDRFPPVLFAHVIDDAVASEAVLASEPTAEQQDLLDRHYLVRLEDGFRVVFAGDFADTPSTILGS